MAKLSNITSKIGKPGSGLSAGFDGMLSVDQQSIQQTQES